MRGASVGYFKVALIFSRHPEKNQIFASPYGEVATRCEVEVRNSNPPRDLEIRAIYLTIPTPLETSQRNPHRRSLT